MTNSQFDAVCKVLTGPEETPGENSRQRSIREALSLVAVAETYDLEPLIDDWIEQAERRGRFAEMLEHANANLQRPLLARR